MVSGKLRVSQGLWTKGWVSADLLQDSVTKQVSCASWRGTLSVICLSHERTTG